MKITTRTKPIIAAALPAAIESAPRPGPTVRFLQHRQRRRQGAGAQQQGQVVGRSEP